MDHPSVEIRFPFDGGDHRLGVPSETTHVYWGAVGLGTLNEPAAALDEREPVSPSALLRTIRERVSCTLTIDGTSEPLLREIRRSGARRQHAFWKAVDTVDFPTIATVTLATSGEAPSIGGEPARLWSQDDEVIPWNETVRTELQLVPVGDTPEMRTDGLWDRHDVYAPTQTDDS